MSREHLQAALLMLNNDEELRIRVQHGMPNSGRVPGVHIMIRTQGPDGREAGVSAIVSFDLIADARFDILATTIQESVVNLREYVRRMSPTTEGVCRYPPDGRYDANCDPGEPGTPCRCVHSCTSPCKGQCGCEACSEAYGDFLSSE